MKTALSVARVALAGLVVVGLSACTGTMSTGAPAAPDRAADEAAIRAVISTVQDSLNRRDYAAFASSMAPEADLIVFDRPKATGLAAVQQAMEAGWSNAPADRMISINIDNIRFVARDVAVIDGTATFSAGEPTSDRSTGVMVRGDGGWRTLALRVMPAAAQ